MSSKKSHNAAPDVAIIDRTTGRELLTATQVAEKYDLSRGTFTSYASRGFAPRPVAKAHGLTLWDAVEVDDWHTESPVRRLRTRG